MGDEVIGIGVFVLALLLPSVVALPYLFGLRGTQAESPRLDGMLVWGVIFAVAAPLLALYAGDHGGASVMLVGLALQAVMHSLAVRKLKKVVAARGRQVSGDGVE